MIILKFSLPFIAAFIGWVTNYLAIKMLFHPKNKIKILFFEIQGIFPKRKDKLAEKLGKMVSNDLISINEIIENIDHEEIGEESKIIMEQKIDEYIDNKLFQKMPMVKMFINEGLRTKLKTSLMEEFKEILPLFVHNYTEKLKKSNDIEKLVYQKVTNFSSDKIEEILFSIMKKEFRFVEISGAVLGFFIGLIQLLLSLI